MSLVLQRIQETREALVKALAERDWGSIAELDLACRACMEDVLSEASVDEDALRRRAVARLSSVTGDGDGGKTGYS